MEGSRHNQNIEAGILQSILCLVYWLEHRVWFPANLYCRIQNVSRIHPIFSYLGTGAYFVEDKVVGTKSWLITFLQLVQSVGIRRALAHLHILHGDVQSEIKGLANTSERATKVRTQYYEIIVYSDAIRYVIRLKTVIGEIKVITSEGGLDWDNIKNL